MTLRTRILKAHPAVLLLASFLLVLTTGAFLLMLPISTQTGNIQWMDALFTATSAVCVTGLVVVDTGRYFTVFGQCVILVLIQIGGLGVMTVSVTLFRWIGRSISFRSRMVMQELFAHTPREDIFSLVRSIALFTLCAETTGAVLLALHWRHEFPLWQAVYTGIFHSVSAFCNAGFTLFSDSMVRYSGNTLINLTVCGLIVFGGIGFPVLYDLQSRFTRREEKRVRLSIQTKSVLITTLILIVSGAVIFAFLERQTLADSHNLSQSILIPLFQSITCRTAGFNTVNIATLKDATLTMMIFLMFFGASPGSCGGGVKTTTLAILIAFTLSRIKRCRRVNMFRKSIPNETVTRSISLILVSIGIIGVVLFLILLGDSAGNHQVSDQHRTFLAYFFETVSAFGTVGLSMGVTPELTDWGKSLIILTMLIGRVGVLTFAYIIVGVGMTNGVEYSEENMMVG
ncbi:ATPase [bacterium]|nr:ATPase [candidate division CSSED10-310 bacterium]